MSWDQGIAGRLRSAGLRVSEVSGWQTRGSSDFNPRGSVNHHTAGGASGSCPSLNTCIYGRPDLAGPLCHVMQSREADGNDIAYVIAAGRANHAGEGGWHGLSGNSSVYGLEIEHTGVDPLPMGRQQIAAAIHAAMFEGDPSMVCQHFEWATPKGRKIDAAENVDANGFRQMVADARTGGAKPPAPKPPEDDDMKMLQGPSAIALISATSWRTLKNMEEANAFASIGVPTARVDAREWDVIKAAVLHADTADQVAEKLKLRAAAV